jgi:hypothetical protein
MMTGHKHRWLPPTQGALSNKYTCADCRVAIDSGECEDPATKARKALEAERRAGKPC